MVKMNFLPQLGRLVLINEINNTLNISALFTHSLTHSLSLTHTLRVSSLALGTP